MTDEKLILFIERKCSLDETRKISDWINANSQNKKYFHELQTIWASIEIAKAVAHEEPDRNSINEILSEVKKLKQSRLQKRFLRYTGIAAAAVIFLFLMLMPFKTHTPAIDYDSLLSENSAAGEIQLLLESGESISISDASAVINYSKNGDVIINEDTIKTKKKEETVLHTIKVPYGRRMKILLSDGSTVHLNSGTSFVYPSVFESQDREVFLQGEASFDIRKDEQKKFIVKTSFKTIEVLGTTFNVFVDKENGLFEAVLVDGKIALNGEKGKIEIAPKQLYKYTEKTKEEIIKKVDAGKYISWINGKIEFEHEPLHAVIRKLERMYNIKITLVDQELLTHHISGELNIKDSPKETMDILMNILIADYGRNTKSKHYIFN